MTTLSRFFQPPKGSYFLFGPRGTGKSTWLRATYPGALWVDLLEPQVLRSYQAWPERLRELVAAHAGPAVVVVNEVQRAPALLNVVHALMEERRHRVRFVLTGSSARKLKRGGVNLLAGRAAVAALHPFVAAELGDRFRIEEALTHGLVPLVWDAEDRDGTLDAYLALYVREEVQSEGLVRDLGNFARFIEAISFSQGAVLNLASVARDCEVSRPTVDGYVQILEDLLLCFRLPVFRRKAKRQLTSHPKFYWFDAGVYRSARPTGPLDRAEEVGGVALETLVAQHLRAWIAYSGARLDMYFWRTKSGSEVDFVLYGRDGLHAIEVKSAARLQPGDLRGLASFREDYPMAKLVLLHGGKERLRMDGVLCAPLETFLRELHPSRPLDA